VTQNKLFNALTIPANGSLFQFSDSNQTQNATISTFFTFKISVIGGSKTLIVGDAAVDRASTVEVIIQAYGTAYGCYKVTLGVDNNLNLVYYPLAMVVYQSTPGTISFSSVVTPTGNIQLTITQSVVGSINYAVTCTQYRVKS
jgi:hypothetical protein